MIRSLVLVILLSTALCVQAGLPPQDAPDNHQPDNEALIEALQSCEEDLQDCRQHVRRLRAALDSTNTLIDRRRAAADSLIKNLTRQLFIQDSVALLMQKNSDTLDTMVDDYARKLDEVDRLYVEELRKQARPWFLSGKGLTGFSYGLFIGGALGLSFAIID